MYVIKKKTPLAYYSRLNTLFLTDVEHHQSCHSDLTPRKRLPKKFW